MILTGGISIGKKEVEYVNDALVNGWDEHATDYIKKFEKAFAKYVGVKHARTLSGGTQALTLAVATLGIGEGDEVILPDMTYFACSDVIKLAGATPVFVDTDPLTWCISAKAFKEAITPKTKAVMPVWLYGNAPEMDEIVQIASENNIRIIEDACPAVGTFYKKKHAGSFGDFGCFSFHPAKIMTTGFGGMLVTNNTELYERMLHLADHGEDKSNKNRFFQTEIGYSFDLPNINCALGLAQLERIEEFVEKKRQIFTWYYQRISDLGDMNFEQKYVRTNKVMTSIILKNKDRFHIMKELKRIGTDTRPFFYPISTFPMYEEQNTPNAHEAGLFGINLPSGVQRTEEEVDIICENLRYLC